MDGANCNHALAFGIVGGMTVVTIAMLFVVSFFFILFQKLHEKNQGCRVEAALLKKLLNKTIIKKNK